MRLHNPAWKDDMPNQAQMHEGQLAAVALIQAQLLIEVARLQAWAHQADAQQPFREAILRKIEQHLPGGLATLEAKAPTRPEISAGMEKQIEIMARFVREAGSP